MIMELYEARNLLLSNTTVKRIAKSYYDYLFDHYAEAEKTKMKLPKKITAIARWMTQFSFIINLVFSNIDSLTWEMKVYCNK